VARFGFPPAAEVGDFAQPARAVGEARLVDDQAGIHCAARDGVDDPVETHRYDVDRAAEREPQQQECGRHRAGDRDADVALEIGERWCAAVVARLADDERPAAASERPAGA